MEGKKHPRPQGTSGSCLRAALHSTGFDYVSVPLFSAHQPGETQQSQQTPVVESTIIVPGHRLVGGGLRNPRGDRCTNGEKYGNRQHSCKARHTCLLRTSLPWSATRLHAGPEPGIPSPADSTCRYSPCMWQESQGERGTAWNWAELPRPGQAALEPPSRRRAQRCTSASSRSAGNGLGMMLHGVAIPSSASAAVAYPDMRMTGTSG